MPGDDIPDISRTEALTGSDSGAAVSAQPSLNCISPQVVDNMVVVVTNINESIADLRPMEGSCVSMEGTLEVRLLPAKLMT